MHANPAALSAALEDARTLGCDRFAFLGDVTGYGYDVRESLRLVRDNFDVVLMGNHDAVCAGMDRRRSVGENRNYDLDREQAKQLTEDELEWICGLPVTYAEDGVAYAHGDFTNPKGWEYVLDAEDARRNLGVRDERLLFCAHTHVASLWEIGPGDETSAPLSRRLVRPARAPETFCAAVRHGCRYVVNCGSVGCPRFDRSIAYAVYDANGGEISIRRLPFDGEGYASELKRRGIQVPRWLSVQYG